MYPMQYKILILNGPNLNLLGEREPEIYGFETLLDIENRCRQKGASLGFSIDFRQSNFEGELISWVQEAAIDGFDGLIINPAGFTHTSISLLDALCMVNIPTIEVHLSQVYKRDAFRHQNMVTTKGVDAVISGLKGFGYVVALDAIYQQLLKDN